MKSRHSRYSTPARSTAASFCPMKCRWTATGCRLRRTPWTRCMWCSCIPASTGSSSLASSESFRCCDGSRPRSGSSTRRAGVWATSCGSPPTTSCFRTSPQAGAVYESTDGTTTKYFGRNSFTRWIVPVDDTHTTVLAFRHFNPRAESPRDEWRTPEALEEIDITRLRHRPYEERQRDPGDYEAVSGQGPITQHGREHLASSDTGVVRYRRRLRSEMLALAEGRTPLQPGAQSAAAIPTYGSDTGHSPPPRSRRRGGRGGDRRAARRGRIDLPQRGPPARGPTLRRPRGKALDSQPITGRAENAANADQSEPVADEDCTVACCSDSRPLLSDAMYRLFTHRDSYGMSAELVLEELGIEYEPIVFNVHVEAEWPEGFTSANPNARVPTLLTEHGPIYESAAILGAPGRDARRRTAHAAARRSAARALLAVAFLPHEHLPAGSAHSVPPREVLSRRPRSPR